VEEVALFALDMPPSERDIVARLERMAREYVEPAAML
jgi:hypothetical protein